MYRKLIVAGMIVALASVVLSQTAEPATWPESANLGTKLAAYVNALAVATFAVVALVAAYELMVGVAQFIRLLYRFCTR